MFLLVITRFGNGSISPEVHLRRLRVRRVAASYLGVSKGMTTGQGPGFPGGSAAMNPPLIQRYSRAAELILLSPRGSHVGGLPLGTTACAADVPREAGGSLRSLTDITPHVVNNVTQSRS